MAVKRRGTTTGRKNGIKQERTWVKTTFSLDPELVERLRAIAFFTREKQSTIVERLIREYVDSSKFRNIPERPAKRE